MDLDRIAGIPAAVDEAAVDVELAHFLDPMVAPAPPIGREPWRISSLGAADWAMRRLTECADRSRAYDDEVRLWQAAAARVAAAGRWFEARLKEWAVAERTPNHKTFTLAHGTVGTRESQPKAVVVDEPAAVQWALVACPDAVKTERSFLISKCGAQVVEWVVGFSAVNRETGEVESIDVAPGPFDGEALAALRERIPSHHVDPVTALFVVDAEGHQIPGLAVQAGSVTANVKPLGL